MLTALRSVTRRKNPLARFSRDERAASMIEFAIVAPLLFALLFGIVDFGRVFFLYNNLTNAAREGARLAAVDSNADIPATVRSRISDSGGPDAAVDVTYVGDLPERTVRVQIVNYPFDPITFFVFPNGKELTVTAEFRLEYQ